jgi:hypothetical protein
LFLASDIAVAQSPSTPPSKRAKSKENTDKKEGNASDGSDESNGNDDNDDSDGSDGSDSSESTQAPHLLSYTPKTDADHEIRITFLGTGSAEPSKVRPVSLNLLLYGDDKGLPAASRWLVYIDSQWL